MRLNSIIITRPVVIKVRVTENYKTALLRQLEYSIRRLDLEVQHLERQTGPDAAARGEAREQLDSELQKRRAARRQLVEQVRSVRGLEPGDEVVQGRVESVTRLRVGDNWQSLMGVEVLLEDGRVVEIRSRSGEARDDGGIHLHR